MRWLFVCLLLTPFCAYAEDLHFETNVVPLPGEDIGDGCHYSLTLPAHARTMRGIWVIFDRAHDVHDMYSDPTVLAFAEQYQLAVLLHHHCPGTIPEDHSDMDMDPSKGLGRALFTALDQLAKATGHRELSTAPLIYFGFSGAGPLCARLVERAPHRALAAILSAPGHYAPFGIDTVKLGQDAIAVPEMILAGGADTVSGTSRPYDYFRTYLDRGAPWVFVLQNNSSHCCTANARDLMLLWLAAVIQARQPSSQGGLRAMSPRGGWQGFLEMEQTNTRDNFRLATFNASGAFIVRPSRQVPRDWQPAGWLPSRAIAEQWLKFVKQRHHPVLPLH